MSERLSCACCGSGTVDPAYVVCGECVDRHEAGIRAQAQREQMEKFAEILCYKCRNTRLYGDARPYGDGWIHAYDYCHAEAIRVAYAKAHPEEAQGE